MEYYIHIYIFIKKQLCVCVCVYLYVYTHTHTYIHTYTHTISWCFKYAYSTSCLVELAVGQQDWGHQSPRIQCQAQPAWNNLHPHGCCIGIQCLQCRVWPKATKALIYSIIKMHTHYIICIHVSFTGFKSPSRCHCLHIFDGTTWEGTMSVSQVME